MGEPKTWRAITLMIAVLAVAHSVTAAASANRDYGRAGQLNAVGQSVWTHRDPSRITLKASWPLKIENIRLDPGPKTETFPSATLTFDVFNESSKRVTDLELEISIVETPSPYDELGPRRVLVQPFAIRGTFVLQPGYAMTYKMLLRNFSSECSCMANVDVLSVHLLPDSEP
jgi:hypothetical protein